MKQSAQIPFLTKITFQEKLLFTKHLDTMIKAGIPITEAIQTLVDQARSQKFKDVLEDVLSSLRNGNSLASSLAKHPKVFDNFFVNLIKIGEKSGNLEENLSFLSTQLSKDFSLRKKIKGALLYPGLIISATTIMGGFIAFFVLPKLTDFFEALEIDLPFTTQILLFVANIMRNYGSLIFITFVAFVILFRFLINLKNIKIHWHTFIIKLPLFGKLIAYAQISRFSRNLGTLIKSGTPVAQSMEITSETLNNLRFQDSLKKITQSLEKGKNIGDSMQEGGYKEYPPIVSRMIKVGEKTGKLDETLLYLANFYEDEIDDISKNLTTIIEPVLLVIIGLVVGFVALAIISPIYDLTGSIE